MTEQELRSLVREAVARHLGGAGCPPAPPGSPSPMLQAAPQSLLASAHHVHVSHGRYLTLANASGACLIEPAVACNHCGFCQSHGH